MKVADIFWKRVMSFIKKMLCFIGAVAGPVSGCSPTNPQTGNDSGAAEMGQEPTASHPVTLTEQAAEQITLISSRNELEPGWRMRIAVQADPNNKGSLLYQMSFADGSETASDLLYIDHNVPLAVSQESIRMIDGTVIDFEVNPDQSGFRFHNPNAVEN